MWIIVKILVSVVLTIALIVIGFALGYPIGKHEGFESGSEWALIQAKLAAREAGVIMPVYLEDGLFHVVLRKSTDGQRTSKQQEAVCEDTKDTVSISMANTKVNEAVFTDGPSTMTAVEEPAGKSEGALIPDK